MVVLASVAGLSCEALASRDDAREHPAPGRLVEVGGHRLHLHCTGSGDGPTVVLEAGLGESSAGWAAVQDRLTTGGRVCSYDRAGYAWSEPGRKPRHADRAAAELHELLTAAEVPKPYLLVGHSYGAHVALLFAHRWPDLTAGLVLVDPTDPGATTALRAAQPLLAAQFAVMSAAGRLGIVRLWGEALVPDGAPSPARQHAPVVYGPSTADAAGAEAAASVDSAAQVRAALRPGSLGDRPLVVIPAADQPPDALEALRAIARQSTRGRLVVAATSDHYVHYAQPGLITTTIDEMRGD